jgi:hypothetical protein
MGVRTALLGVSLAHVVACGARGGDDPPDVRLTPASHEAAAAVPADVRVTRPAIDPDVALDVRPTVDSDERTAPFAGCRSNEDCIAVPEAGCCPVGWKVAVNRDQRACYEAALRCDEAHPICIRMLVVDRRDARCNPASGLCEMKRAE